MNNIGAISFLIPIVPKENQKLTIGEWVRTQADGLISWSNQVYRIEKDSELKIEEAPRRTTWEIAVKIAMIATGILPLVAFVIKMIDRLTHRYTLAQSPKAEVKHEPAPVVSEVKSEQPLPKVETNSISEEMTKIDLARQQEEEEIKKKEEEKRLQAEAKEKALADEERKKEEKIGKCHLVAQRFFPEMLKMYYNADGHLNNECLKSQARARFWGMRDEEYPENLRDKAEDLELDGKTQEAEKCRAKADLNEKQRDEFLETKFQQTLFPFSLDGGGKITREECFSECSEDLSKREFFHGTSKERAEKIKANGFDPEWPAGHRILDSGYGVYMALNKKDAEGYARNAPDKQGAVLQIKVKANSKLANYNKAMYQIVNNCFVPMAQLFTSLKEKEILEELQKEGVPGSADRWDVNYPLVNLFTRDFYTRQGYRGVFAHYSDRANCTYLNIFYPKEDIEAISQL